MSDKTHQEPNPEAIKFSPSIQFVSLGAESENITSEDQNCCALTSKGTREQNEDAALVAKDLIIIADGMGGTAAGEIASHETIVAAYQQLQKDPNKELTREPFDAACQALLENYKNIPDVGLKGNSGSTLVIVKKKLLDANTTYFEIGHVGDSHVIAISLNLSLQGLGIYYESTDQSVVGMEFSVYPNSDPLLRYTHPQKNFISNAILPMEKTYEAPELFTVEGTPGDIIIIACSDGVTTFVSPEEIENIVIDQVKPRILITQNRKDISLTTDPTTEINFKKTEITREDLPVIIERIKNLALSRQNQPTFEILLQGTKRVVNDYPNGDNITVAAMI